MTIFKKLGIIFLKSTNSQIYSEFIAYEQFRKNLMNFIFKLILGPKITDLPNLMHYIKSLKQSVTVRQFLMPFTSIISEEPNDHN